jgi:hypothetical protein
MNMRVSHGYRWIIVIAKGYHVTLGHVTPRDESAPGRVLDFHVAGVRGKLLEDDDVCESWHVGQHHASIVARTPDVQCEQ